MRHLKGFNHLGRTSSHRKAMLSNMAASLIVHKRIFTTLAKAKALRSYVEPLITKSKDDSTHARRTVFSYLQSKQAVTELFREVSKAIVTRPGGYTRIIKTGNRPGDNAEMCMMELVDFNPNYIGQAKRVARKDKVKTRRAGKKAKSAPDAIQETKAIESTNNTVEEPVMTKPEVKSEPVVENNSTNEKE